MKANEIKTTIATTINANNELATIKSRIEESVKKFNEARDKGDMKIMATLQATLDDDVSEYATKAAKLTYETLAGVSEDLLPAILAYEFPVVVYRDQHEREEIGGKKTTITTRVVEVKMRRIDLMKFDNFCEKTYGKRLTKEGNAWSMIEELNFYLTKRAAQEIGAKMEKPYAFSKFTTIGDIKPADVIGASNTKLLATLQRVIDAVIYEPGQKGNKYKATSHDVRYLDRCAVQKAKARLTIKGAKHQDMRDTIGNVIYRIATGGDYEIEYKEAKQK